VLNPQFGRMYRHGEFIGWNQQTEKSSKPGIQLCIP
jgi:hypothetical protein